MLKDKIVNVLRKVVINHDIKNGKDKKETVYICTRIETRNRYKNDAYKIPKDQPQCPVFQDNRCCGGCDLAASCDHCVNCGCFGFTYARMGGNDKGYFMHKASMFAEHGQLDENGKFDWEAYKLNTFMANFKKDHYFIASIDGKWYIAKTISEFNKETKQFKVYVEGLNEEKTLSYKKDADEYTNFYPENQKELLSIKLESSLYKIY